jgi:hypothetical protein
MCARDCARCVVAKVIRFIPLIHGTLLVKIFLFPLHLLELKVLLTYTYYFKGSD